MLIFNSILFRKANLTIFINAQTLVMNNSLSALAID